jgi:hypothetical protein
MQEVFTAVARPDKLCTERLADVFPRSENESLRETI